MLVCEDRCRDFEIAHRSCAAGFVMRIAQVAPLAESVPPKLYGGTERVIAWLTKELISLGHEVTLFASGDSATSATLVPVWPRALRLGRPKCDPAVAETALLEVVAQHAHRVDVIHCHTNWTHLPLLTRLGVPFLTTLHNRLDTPGLPDVVTRFPAAPFISISDDHAASTLQMPCASHPMR
jgi:glycosyltransferase involved in cell wall biosynthesis